MDFTVQSNDAQLTNFNSRTEGNKDAPQPACDADFELITDGAILQTLLASDHVPPFWDENGDPIYYGLKPMGSKAEIKSAYVTFGEIELVEVKVKKFGFKPISGRQVELSLQVQVSNPTDEQYVALFHAQLAYDKLHIKTAQADMFE